jgi:RHS repeat-associated protein
VYDPYGERTVIDADWTSDSDGLSDVAWHHGHQGGRHAPGGLNLVNFRFRELITPLGRWEKQDPAGYVDGLSLYGYVQNNPIVHVDWAGLCSDLPGGGKPGPIEDFALKADQAAYDIEKEMFPQFSDPFSGDYRHCVAGCIVRRTYGYILGSAILHYMDYRETDPMDSRAHWAGFNDAFSLNPFNEDNYLRCRELCLKDKYLIRPAGPLRG